MKVLHWFCVWLKAKAALKKMPLSLGRGAGIIDLAAEAAGFEIICE